MDLSLFCLLVGLITIKFIVILYIGFKLARKVHPMYLYYKELIDSEELEEFITYNAKQKREKILKKKINLF